jgi:hypothetical protein
VTQENIALALPASSLLANDTDPNGYALSITSVSGPSNGTVTYNTSTQVVTFVPANNYMGPAGFAYSITNGNGGTASATVSLTVTAPALSLFSASSSPGTITVNDSGSVELGVKFQASAAGKIVGLRFYKGPQNIGTHIGNLWTVGGGLLATANFVNETASGWQQVHFSTPVTVALGTTYVASYHAPSGFYSADANYYLSTIVSGPLTALASAAAGGNGIYAYGTSSSFPLNTYNSTNYWIDVLFTLGS